MRRAAATAALAALVLAAGAAAAGLGPIAFVPASPRNYAHVVRPASSIRMVVIHDIEGTAGGAISWFRNRRARASANYVVSRDGEVTQMVSDRNIAWHAGNGYVNAHSIGIEHEGYVGITGIYTDAEYRASAELVAQLVAKYRIPLDRRHLIGHSEVPDPRHPGQFGGVSHHRDPGPTWDWKRYMSYVTSYLHGTTPPPLPFDVTIPEIQLAQTVRGVLDWEALPAGEEAASVDFELDGRLLATATEAPWALAWDSTTAANGRHLLTVHAVALDGRTADASVVVVVSNPPAPPQILTDTIAEGATLSGTVRWEVTTKRKVGLVQFLVDGLLVDAEFSPPYGFDWDTTQETPGPHTLTVQVTNPAGTATATQTLHVTIAAVAP